MIIFLNVMNFEMDFFFHYICSLQVFQDILFFYITFRIKPVPSQCLCIPMQMSQIILPIHLLLVFLLTLLWTTIKGAASSPSALFSLPRMLLSHVDIRLLPLCLEGLWKHLPMEALSDHHNRNFNCCPQNCPVTFSGSTFSALFSFCRLVITRQNL